MTDINPLAYKPTLAPYGAKFKISPSSFSKFIEKPHQWYRDEVLKENPFAYNTSTVIGTVVHYIAHMVAEKKEVNKKAIKLYIDSFEANDVYNPDTVRQHYIMMAETLVNDYVLKNPMLEVETQHITELVDGYYAGGTVDRLEGSKEDCMVVDYKTYSSPTKPKVIPNYYKYQLLVYAYILSFLGYNVTRIRLVYVSRYIDGGISEKTGKPLKSYPTEITVLTENITNEDLAFIESLLELCVDSLKAAEKYPELTHVIFHDQRLKQE